MKRVHCPHSSFLNFDTYCTSSLKIETAHATICENLQLLDWTDHADADRMGRGTSPATHIAYLTGICCSAGTGAGCGPAVANPPDGRWLCCRVSIGPCTYWDSGVDCCKVLLQWRDCATLPNAWPRNLQEKKASQDDYINWESIQDKSKLTNSMDGYGYCDPPRRLLYETLDSGLSNTHVNSLAKNVTDLKMFMNLS